MKTIIKPIPKPPKDCIDCLAYNVCDNKNKGELNCIVTLVRLEYGYNYNDAWQFMKAYNYNTSNYIKP